MGGWVDRREEIIRVLGFSNEPLESRLIKTGHEGGTYATNTNDAIIAQAYRSCV